MLVSRAEATVTQVDGTTLPALNKDETTLRMQTVLDSLDGVGSLDAVKDAAEQPQIFTPAFTQSGNTTTANVTFRYRSGTVTQGFKNGFGWYNVGDDVSTPSLRAVNLHPVLGCGVDMALQATGNDMTGVTPPHQGNPTFYNKNIYPGADGLGANGSIIVDFAKEQAAGRYKGGFVGFYLISPENSADPNFKNHINCGDFKNDPTHAGQSLFGHIYFTQKDLNNDGDFVHHLVYHSKTVPNRYMFGFEDLFRGGDNDFEDLALGIDGLVPPCVPSAEICDGVDNNCDQQIDNNPVDVGVSCTCDNVSMPCVGGAAKGKCLNGLTVCQAGGHLACQPGTPTAEVCNNIDDNCNGQIDDAPTDPTVGKACDGPDADQCATGINACQNGAIVCVETGATHLEVCNGIDDNCNGQVDEGDPGGGGACGSSLGVCTPGVFHCVGGSLQCQGGVQPSPEICDGLDNNCDGQVDNNVTGTGQDCGSSEGVCRPGTMVCTGGTLQCSGGTGPTNELCNGLDDDCNGTVDDKTVDSGVPCGTSSIGACKLGTTVCVGGGLVCQGAVGPTDEICDGIDNNCDGTIDNNVQGENQPCGAGAGGQGACHAGLTKCIAGQMQCVGGDAGGTEVCNGKDDDCDGQVDNGAVCPDGGACIDGVCAEKCVAGEFPCPSGQICDASMHCVVDPCAGVICTNDADGNLQICNHGSCESQCLTTKCPTGFVCRGSDAACVIDNCDYLPSKCAAGELCINSICATDPCMGMTCAGDQFCRGGQCIASCEGVRCKAGEACSNGQCEATGCKTDCGSDICNRATGQCQTSRCSGGISCPGIQVCEPATGDCVTDPCLGVTCPSGQTCSQGECGLNQGGGLVTAGGGGGCSAGGDGSLGAGLALAVLAWLRRSRRRRTGHAVAGPLPAMTTAAVLAVSLLGGCKMNNYCLECEVGDGGINGNGPGDGGTGPGGGSDDGGNGSGAQCDPNQIHTEVCNGVDDNCDGQIDEGFDLQTDAHNCGACGVQCNKPGAITACIAGQCQITACFPGFFDRDNDIPRGYANSDGCEYPCFKSNGGVEACDGLDNNCDGQIDEGFLTTTDPNNCGACNHVCGFFGVQQTECVDSVCQFKPSTDCKAGFIDIDGKQDNGCEYACTPSNNGVEICDGRDNNCNNVIDEGFDLTSDVHNCGACGRTCQFPNVAKTSCSQSKCTFDPAHDCAPNFFDIDGNPQNGCEYQCTKTNGGVEICDGKDNDCDGIADDNLPTDLGTCSSKTPATGACKADGHRACSGGQLVCLGATSPTPETCDGIDNDCDGTVDNNLTGVACYDGPPNTSGTGVCKAGALACTGGTLGACVGEVLPGTEVCNGKDDDCDGRIDTNAAGLPLTQSCYSAADQTTKNVGICKSGIQTCSLGAFGQCAGEVLPAAHDICGDGLDNDCNGKNDTAEGCQVADAEARLEAPGGTLGETNPGAVHSYDVVFARGANIGTGATANAVIYAAWSQFNRIIPNGNDSDRPMTVTDVFFRRSRDGGKTWDNIVNVTAGITTGANPASAQNVKPILGVIPANGSNPEKVIIVYQTVSTSGTDKGTRDIVFQISTNAAMTTFTAQSAALDTDPPVVTGMPVSFSDSFHQVIAVSGTTCVITWEQLDTVSLNRDIVSRTSTTCGATAPTFAAAVTVNTSSTGANPRFAGRPQVALTNSNPVRIVWAWREQRTITVTPPATPPPLTRDVFANSAAVGSAPGTDIAIDTDSTADADFPVLRVNENTAYLTWQNVATSANNGSDVMFSRSTNGGTSWSAAQIIDDPTGEVSASFTPALAIDPKTAGNQDDVVALAWEDRRQGSQIFVSVSQNGGASFNTPTRASSDHGVPITGTTTIPQIAAQGNGVLAVAYQNQALSVTNTQTGVVTTPPPHIFVATSIDSGATWTFTQFRADGSTGTAGSTATGAVGPAIIPTILPTLISGVPASFTAWTDFRANQINGDTYMLLSH